MRPGTLHPGTCQWIFSSPAFRDWVTGTDPRRTLFCPGQPGAGKTIAASAIVQELASRFENDSDVGIAHIFFNKLRSHEQSIEAVCQSLTEQLVKRGSDTAQSDWSPDGDAPTPFIKTLRQMRSTVEKYRQVFIIVDALDECMEAGRARFVEEMVKLEEHYGARLLVTSRGIPEVTDLVEEAIRFDIVADDGDLQRYVVDSLGRFLPLAHAHLDTTQGAQLTLSIVEASAGRFLAARLYMGLLACESSQLSCWQAVRENFSLLTGPDVYRGLYGVAVGRIASQMDGQNKLALSWLTFATRQLTMTELQEALAIPTSNSNVNPDTRPDITEILETCRPLLVWDPSSDIVSFVHNTAREYLLSRQDLMYPEADIGTACIRYLSMSEFETGACPSNEGLKERLQSRPLFQYAAVNWAHHLETANEPPSEVYEFLRTQPKIQAAFQMSLIVHKLEEAVFGGETSAREMSGLHMAAYAGVPSVIKSLLAASTLLNTKSDVINKRDDYGQTPLCWAAQMGHQAVVQLLLTDPAVKIDLRNYQGRTPLSLAAEQGDAEIVRSLLACGANPNYRDVKHTTPLWYASRAGHGAIVELLLRTGNLDPVMLNARQPYQRSERGETPLFIATKGGHTRIVELLLD
ncbi:ankyrin, partial [Canariomyces notabilis]